VTAILVITAVFSRCFADVGKNTAHDSL